MNKCLYERYFKRILDLLLSLIALILLSPIILITAILVRIKLGSPILFVQERPGLNNKIFKMYKFRTMTDEKDEFGNLLDNEKRRSKFGDILRKISIDELPSLINIIKGDMSIIGPRPLLTKYMPYYTDIELLRHSVKPGLTGLAQINGRNNLMWDERLSLDVDYVNDINLKRDFKILLLTLKKVIISDDVVSVSDYKMQNLDIERKNKIRQKILTVDEIKKYKNRIIELLKFSYLHSFPEGKNVSHNFENKINDLMQYIKNGNTYFLAVFDENNLIGFIWFFIEPSESIHINHFVVDEKYSSKGFGSLLIQYVENFSFENKINSINLIVTNTNLNAINFYMKKNYAIDRLILRKDL